MKVKNFFNTIDTDWGNLISDTYSKYNNFIYADYYKNIKIKIDKKTKYILKPKYISDTNEKYSIEYKSIDKKYIIRIIYNSININCYSLSKTVQIYIYDNKDTNKYRHHISFLHLNCLILHDSTINKSLVIDKTISPQKEYNEQIYINHDFFIKFIDEANNNLVQNNSEEIEKICFKNLKSIITNNINKL